MATSEGIGSVCRELGLSNDIASALCQRLLERSNDGGDTEVSAHYAAMAEREAEIMQLLGTTKPERVLHDLRNVLNELTLLKAAADLE